MSELAVKPRRTVRAPGADRLQLRDLTHQRQTSSLVQNRISLRTVRAPRADRPQFTFQPKPEKQPLWYKFEISRRTVRSPWPDCPPFNFEAHTRETPFLVQKRNTVADRPPNWAGLSASPPEPLQALWNGRGLSAVTQSALKLSLFQIFSKRR